MNNDVNQNNDIEELRSNPMRRRRCNGRPRWASAAVLVTSSLLIGTLVPIGVADGATASTTVTVGPAPTTSLYGTFMNSPDDPLFALTYGPEDPAGCDKLGSSSVDFSSRGPVSGPFVGTMTFAGNYTIGAQTTPKNLGYPADVGPITSLNGTFGITSGGTTIEGTFTGLGPSTGGSVGLNEGSCYGAAGAPGGFGYAEIDSGTVNYLDAVVTYTATVTAASGVSYASGKALFRQRQQCVDSVTPAFQGCGSSGPVFNFYSPAPGADTTAPALAPVVTPGEIVQGGTAVIEPNADDPESGIAYVACEPVDASTVGTFDAACSATNGAGLTTTRTVSYSVTAPVPVSTVSIADVTVVENPPPNGHGQLIFTFTPALTDVACLRFRHIDGTAIRGSDYFSNDGRTCFPVGATTAVTGIAIYDDGLTEGPETFEIEIYDLVGVAPGNTRATWTIVDAEPTAPVDSDGDGLWDVIEIWLGCDPHNSDTDGDGVSDYVEIVIGTDPLLSDTYPDDAEPSDGSYLVSIYGHLCGCGPEDDADGDGVSTWIELRWGTDPGLPDTDGPGGFSGDLEYIWHLCGCSPLDEDGDGIPTIVERYYGGGGFLQIIQACGCRPWEDPSGGGGIWIDFIYLGGYTPLGDDDGDGIDTLIELWLGCNPDDPDTDGDGLNDLEELDLGTNPLDSDTDGDGLSDSREIELGCDPLDPDTDGDGRLDGEDPAPLVGVVLTVNDGGVPVPLGTAITGRLECIGQPTAALIDWGDGTSSLGTSEVDTPHVYAAAGVYDIVGSCSDATGGTQSENYGYAVVYDGSNGFVTGGGWIASPAGALVESPTSSGKASFGFVAKYQKGATTPSGETEFQFHAAGFDFHSVSYDWLVIAGSKAQYKGVGEIKGRTSTFRFMLTAIDGGIISKSGPDKFRIKIWDDSGVVYDSQLGNSDTAEPTTLLGGGAIVIHKPK